LIGKSLAHYEIIAKIGEGGMGEVYHAHDTKLGREVALKLLPYAWASDAERVARFEREARTLASLHHPNIASIFGFEEVDGVRFLVMEMVEGEELAQRLERGALAVGETVELARQIALGLESAHGKGIIHRDLKPGNIKLTATGQVKILDFGLARAAAVEPQGQDLAHSPTITAGMTQAGVILGTAAYMSPEQAKGRPVDQRTDVWAYGCVLFEMLAGHPAFGGDNVTDVLASIVRDEPSWDALPASVPPRLTWLLRRCLAKDPDERLRDLGDVRLLLGECLLERTDSRAGSRTPPRERRWIWPTAVGLLLVALVSLALLGPPSRDRTSERSPTVAISQLTDLAGLQIEPALSPDGRQLLYVSRDRGDWDIFLLRVGGENAINLTENSAADDVQPAFSPDGERIAFASEREGGGVFVMGATGETPRRVADTGFDPAWSPDGTKLVYTTEYVTDPYARLALANLWVLDLETGNRQRLDDIDATGPHWSPNGHRIAFWTHLETIQGQRDLWTIPAEGGEPSAVLIDAHTDWDPVWSPDGRWLYFLSDRGGSPDLWRVAVDEQTGERLGDPQPVTVGMTQLRELSIAVNGRIAVTSMQRSGSILKAGFDPVAEKVIGEPTVLYSSSNPLWQMEISRDDRMLAFGTTAPRERIYIIDADGSRRRKLTDDEFRNRGPSFSPDGDWIVFYSNRSGAYGIWAIRTDGTDLKLVAVRENTDLNEPVWRADGRLIAVMQDPEISCVEILLPDGGLAELQGPCEIERLPGSEGISAAAWSPTGRYGAGGSGIGWFLSIYSVEDESYERLEFDGMPISVESSPAWLDDHRIVFWHVDRQRGLLWDHETREFRPVDGLPGPGQYAFDDTGQTIYMNVYEPESDVWLLTLQNGQ
jgi:serine/threonine protein kinase